MGTCLHCFRHAGLPLNFFFTNMNIVWRALWCHMWQFDRKIDNSYPGPTSWKKNGGPFASYETHFVVFSTCSLGQWLGVKLFQKTMHLQECTTSLINTLLQVLNPFNKYFIMIYSHFTMKTKWFYSTEYFCYVCCLF